MISILKKLAIQHSSNRKQKHFSISFFRHHIIGLLRIGLQKIRITRCTCANVPCKIRPVLNWPITRLKIWLGYRKCSAENGSIYSCRPKPSPKLTKRGTNKKERSWIHKKGPSGTYTDLHLVVSIPPSSTLKKFASCKTVHLHWMTSGKS